MTDNNQDAPVQRLHYFDQQFLREPDFTAEQVYHVRMRRLHNRAFHTWGIAEGLRLEGIGTRRVTVTPGIAIDRLGQEMVLTRETATDDLAEYRDQTIYITIAYDEEETNPTSDTGVTGNTRWTEQPAIRVSTEPPTGEEQGISLILGRARLNGAGEIENIDDGEGDERRRETGVRAGDLQAESATVAGDVAVGGNLSVGGRSDLTGDTRVRAPLTVDPGVATTLGGALSVGGAATMETTLRVAGATTLDSGLSVTGDLSVDGNVGIGTTSPEAPLHVASYMAVGPFSATGGVGGIDVTGHDAELGFAKRSLTAWPDTPGAGDRFTWYNPDGSARLWTHATGDLMTVTATGQVGIGTTNPQASLHIDGGALRIGGTREYIPSRGTGAGSFGDFVQLEVMQPQRRARFRFETASIDFWDYEDREVMSIHSNGVRVGGTERGTGRINLGTFNAGDYIELGVRSDDATFNFQTRNLQFASAYVNNAMTLDAEGRLTTRLTKNFRISHPLRAGYDLVHSCLEGPENGVYYRGTAQLQDGRATVQLPDYFEALTRPEDRTVQLTAIGPEPFLLSYTSMKQGTFTVYGSHPEGAFAWHVTAVRADVPPLEVEVKQED